MKKTIIRFVVRILFLLLAVMMLFPIYFMVIASFKPSSALFKNGIAMVWQFDNLSIQNYIYTVTTKSGIYLKWYGNSILVMAVSTVLSLFFSSMGGYALGAYKFKGKKFLFTLTMIVMMIPLEILLISYDYKHEADQYKDWFHSPFSDSAYSHVFFPAVRIRNQ